MECKNCFVEGTTVCSHCKSNEFYTDVNTSLIGGWDNLLKIVYKYTSEKTYDSEKYDLVEKKDYKIKKLKENLENFKTQLEQNKNTITKNRESVFIAEDNIKICNNRIKELEQELEELESKKKK
jgi:peptidoglycan hydrolase CwlO-like protein